MKRSLRLSLIIAGAVILLVAIGAVAAGIFIRSRTTPAPAAAVPVAANDKVLIIAPHPDDETLGPGLVARQAVKAGAKVKVVVVTEGDAGTHAAQAEFKTLTLTPNDYIQLGLTRHKESLAAMRGLGVTDLEFLGFADGSTNSLWRGNWDDDNPHLGRNGKTAVPYSFAADKGAVYSGNTLATNLTQVIKDYNPTVIFYPTPEDMHHDHWAVNAFTQYALASLKIQPREYTYLVHRGGLWPTPPVYAPAMKLNPPAGLSEIDAKWLRYQVDKVGESDKRAAVRKYKSQMTVNGIWLQSFIRTNELFAVYPEETATRAGAVLSILEGAPLLGLSFKDFEAFELSKTQGAEGDIRRFSFAYDPQYVYIAAEFEQPLGPDLVMMANMRFFTANGVNRVDVRILNGEAVALPSAANAVVPPEGVKLVQNSNTVVVRLPASVIGNADTVMVNVDTFNAGTTEDDWLDRTPWRRISLK